MEKTMKKHFQVWILLGGLGSLLGTPVFSASTPNGPVILHPASQYEALYAWRSVQCEFKEDAVHVVLQSKDSSAGSLSFSVPLNESKGLLSSHYLSKSRSVRFKDRQGTVWRVANFEKSHCEWHFYNVQEQEGKVTGFELGFTCVHLRPESKSSIRPSISVKAPNLIRCHQTNN